MGDVPALYERLLHPHHLARLRGDVQPVKTSDERVGVNGKIGQFITVIVGTMWCAYLFTILAFISFPAAIKSGDKIIIVGWVAQTFLQLVLLPIIIVGTNILGKAQDKRAEQTYADTEAILHLLTQIAEKTNG